MGGAIGSTASGLINHEGLGQSLLRGVGTYAGSSLAGNVLGNKLGTVGGAFDSAFGGTGSLSNFVGNSLSGELANTGIASILGGNIGGDLASSFGATEPRNSSIATGLPTYNPSRMTAQATPPSLQGLGGLTNEQQLSNIANQGVYGGGQGKEENSYFLNLLNRQLIDDSGKMEDTSTVNPIEQSYLQRLGLGGQGNSRSLLEAISKWQPT